MKHLFISLLFIGITVNVFSQSKIENLPSAEKRAEFQTAMMVKEFELSEEQEEKITQINLEKAKEADAVFKISNRRERYKAYRKLTNKKNEQLKEVLTTEQYEHYQKRKKEFRKKLIEQYKKDKN